MKVIIWCTDYLSCWKSCKCIKEILKELGIDFKKAHFRDYSFPSGASYGEARLVLEGEEAKKVAQKVDEIYDKCYREVFDYITETSQTCMTVEVKEDQK